MPLIASENYTTKRIFLSIDSVGVDVQPIDIYTEHRERRRLNAGGERKFSPMVSAIGNQQIGSSKFTPRFTNLAAGVRIVPYDTSHSLLIRGAMISIADSLEGRDLFDRSSLVASVDIDYQPPQVEIITVNTGSGLDSGQAAQLTAATASAARAEALLEADEKIRADRYQKLSPNTATVILDKDVTVSGDDIDLVEHV